MNLGSVRFGWLDSFVNDGKQEKNLERIRRKMFVLYVSTLEMAKIAKKEKKLTVVLSNLTGRAQNCVLPPFL